MSDDRLAKISNEEYQLLKKYAVLHPKNLMSRPMPPSATISSLIEKGLITEITRPEAKGRTPPLIVGYEVIEKGRNAISDYEKVNLSR